MRRLIFPIIILLAFSVSANSQDFKKLGDDPAVTRLALPDGIPCILVANGTSGSTLDAAILQRTCQNDSGVQVKRMLTDSLMLHGKPFINTLVRNGIQCGKEGFIESIPEGDVVRFKGFQTTRPEASLDTLLYAITSVIGNCIKEDPIHFGTDNQTIIIAGNFDKAAVTTKLKLFSMNVPAHKSSAEPLPPYEWKEKEASCDIVEEEGAQISTVEVNYFMQRTKPEDMPSVLPTVSRQMASSLCAIAEKRLHKALFRRDIPYAKLTASYLGSDVQGSDEQFSINLRVPSDSLLSAVRTVAYVLGNLDSEGAGEGETAAATGAVWADAVSRLNAPVSNEAWIQRCLGAILYNADLSPVNQKIAIFRNADLQNAETTRLLGRYVSSVLDAKKNLEIYCTVPSGSVLKKEDVLAAYEDGWTPASVREATSEAARAAASKKISKNFEIALADTAYFTGPYSGRPVKVKKTTTEVASGGFQWALPNGITVIYKKAATGGLMYYSLLMNGGRSNVDKSREGEGAFLADIFNTFDVNGKSGYDFRSILSGCDITMNCRAEYADCFIEGFAPGKKLPLLMSSLLTIGESRKVSTEAFDYWYKCEKLRLEDGALSPEGRLAAMDAVMCPNFVYSPCKIGENMSPTMLERADAFFSGRFAKINDGALVLVGDMDEAEVLKILCNYIPKFSTNNSVTSRASTIFRLASGEGTIRGNAGFELVDMILTSELMLAAENKMASLIAVDVLETELQKRLAPRGIWVSVAPDFIMAPRERLELRIMAGQVSSEGRSDGTDISMNELKDEILGCISYLATTALAPADLNPPKNLASSKHTATTAYPTYWIDIICSRLAEGKDFNTKFADKFAAANPEKIRQIMELLSKNGKVEYLVTY